MLPEVLKLAESPLLQGGALSAMLDFFKTIVAAGLPGLGHSDLLALLAHPVLGSKGGSIHKVLRFTRSGRGSFTCSNLRLAGQISPSVWPVW